MFCECSSKTWNKCILCFFLRIFRPFCPLKDHCRWQFQSQAFLFYFKLPTKKCTLFSSFIGVFVSLSSKRKKSAALAIDSFVSISCLQRWKKTAFVSTFVLKCMLLQFQFLGCNFIRWTVHCVTHWVLSKVILKFLRNTMHLKV